MDDGIDSRDILGNTALCCAVQYEHEKMVQWLCDNGANVTTLNSNGLAPIHIHYLYLATSHLTFGKYCCPTRERKHLFFARE